MLWRVQYKKRLGLVRHTMTEASQDAAIACALRLLDKGYSVIAVGTDTSPHIFGSHDIERLFAHQHEQGPSG
jgi:predicted kinase